MVSGSEQEGTYKNVNPYGPLFTEEGYESEGGVRLATPIMLDTGSNTSMTSERVAKQLKKMGIAMEGPNFRPFEG